jgi:putative PEP-CTERM system histidine kinase
VIVGTVAYGLAAGAFALLALLCATSWRGGAAGKHLAIACAVTAAWAAILGSWASGGAATPTALYAAEALRHLAWLGFLAYLLPGKGFGSAGGRARWAVLAAGLAIAAAGILAGGGTPMPLIPAGLGAAVLGLVLLEQIYRNSRPERRWAVKFLLVGVGGLFAYDLFLYSHALLFRGLDANLWVARGFANAMAVPLLAIAVRRNPELSVDLFVSRHVTFYTAALVGVGGYLLAMAAAGYGIRLWGGSWGATLQAAFFFGAAVLLAAILLSDKLRSRARVFIAKHFYANRYDYREEWLRLTATLSDDAEPLPQRALRALAEIVEAAGGALWERRGGSVGEPRLERTAARGAGGPAVLAPHDPLVRFLAARHWTVHARAVVRDPGAYEGLSLPGWLEAFGPDALAVPLVNQDQLYGVAVLRDPRPGIDLDYEDIDLLRIAGRQAAAVLAQAEADRLLTEGRQFEAFNRLTAFLMHDLKNLIAQQSMVVRNAARHRHDPAFVDDAVETIDNSVKRMQRLLEQLKDGSRRELRERVELGALLARVVADHVERAPAPTLDPPAGVLHVQADPERLAMVIGHVVRNAQDATPADGAVTVSLRQEGDEAVIEVADTGAGMDEEFVRERLFRPFDSTKGSKGMGIGAHQARQFAEQAGGSVQVESRAAAGTRFRVRLPLAPAFPAQQLPDADVPTAAAAATNRERLASG